MSRWMTGLNAVFWGVSTITAATVAYDFFFVRNRPTPFNPVVSFGRPAFTKLKDGTVSVALPLSLSNSGVQSGCISDVALKLRSEATHTTWTYFPAFFLDTMSYFKGKTADPFDAFEATLGPIKLAGSDRVGKGILFMPRPPSNHKPIQASDLTPDEYSFEIFVASTGPDCSLSDSSKFLPAAKTEYFLTADLIGQLANGLKVQPLDKATESLRDIFVKNP